MFPVVASADQEMAVKKNESTWTGTVAAVNPQNSTITGKWWWFTKTFNLGDNCAISVPDKNEGALSDLRPGEKVKIRYQDVEGVLVADRITERPLHCRGTVRDVDRNAKTVMIEGNTAYKRFLTHNTFGIAGDCRVILPDGRNGGLDDLRPGSMLAIFYELPDNSPVAYRIKVKSSTFVGTVDAIDLSQRTVKPREMLGEKKFNLADGCRIVVNGNQNAQLKDLELGRKYQFTYEDVNGVDVVNRIAPIQGTKPVETASTR